MAHPPGWVGYSQNMYANPNQSECIFSSDSSGKSGGGGREVAVVSKVMSKQTSSETGYWDRGYLCWETSLTEMHNVGFFEKIVLCEIKMFAY